MSVIRDGRYITSIIIDNVKEFESSASIRTARDKNIQVGDIVFFDRGELDKIEASQNSK